MKCKPKTGGNANGECECECLGCLEQVSDAVQGSSDVTCTIKCNCGEECSTYDPNDPDNSDYGASGADCTGTCTTCTPSSDTACGEDRDCIDEGISADSGFCVDSAICTKSKEKVCDKAWKAVSGKNDNSAKCCPATSGCIKSQIGVTKTSTCSTNCGSCLTSKQGKKQGKTTYQIPTTFCRFGDRLGKSWHFISSPLCLSVLCLLHCMHFFTIVFLIYVLNPINFVCCTYRGFT